MHFLMQKTTNANMSIANSGTTRRSISSGNNIQFRFYRNRTQGAAESKYQQLKHWFSPAGRQVRLSADIALLSCPQAIIIHLWYCYISKIDQKE